MLVQGARLVVDRELLKLDGELLVNKLARWGPRSPFPKGGRAPQIFGPCLLWPKGWMDEAGTWHGGSSKGYF